ncbi:uncharacterized protein LOC123673600 isoform X2 [Harmonia axyridis]|uniref:uncharacterized protein LOC123673600 isoform X2 n=1 Tax=Harmonia axyridis TaxID=115357 RepID=UPI001E2792FC|nr:uncharacterized protein LOC123673600 isoform X2 [Harmonia axyridis]
MKVCSKHFEESDFHTQSKELRHADLCLRPRKTNLRRNLSRYDPVQQPILKSDCEVMTQNQDGNELHAQEMIHRPDELLAAEALCAFINKDNL